MSRKFYIFKCVKENDTLYIGTTTRELSNRIACLKRMNEIIVKDADIYYLECVNKEFMEQMCISAILFYKPKYNKHIFRYQKNPPKILDINFDVLDWKEYKKDVIAYNKNIKNKNIRFPRRTNINTPISLDKWTFVCPENIILTNDHIELLSFIYGNPSINKHPQQYSSFNGATSFYHFTHRYDGIERIKILLSDLSQIQILLPTNINSFSKDNIFSLSSGVENWKNIKMPLILYSKDKNTCQPNLELWQYLCHMIQMIMESELFYIWYIGDEPHLETCWVSQAKYDSVCGFTFMNPLLRYETDFQPILKRCEYQLVA